MARYHPGPLFTAIASVVDKNRAVEMMVRERIVFFVCHR